MKLIIAGSRTIKDYTTVRLVIERGIDYLIKSQPLPLHPRVIESFYIQEVVSGHAPGVDRLGERWAKERGIKLTIMEPDYSQYGRRAPLIRNRSMGEYIEHDQCYE